MNMDIEYEKIVRFTLYPHELDKGTAQLKDDSVHNSIKVILAMIAQLKHAVEYGEKRVRIETDDAISGYAHPESFTITLSGSEDDVVLAADAVSFFLRVMLE